MTREQVIASEDADVDSELQFGGQLQLVFHARLDGHYGSITYILENNQLRAATYSFRNDEKRQVYSYMKDFLTNTYGKPAFQEDAIVGWRLERSEVALAYLPDKFCYAAFWEKAYFARMNNLSATGDNSSFLKEK